MATLAHAELNHTQEPTNCLMWAAYTAGGGSCTWAVVHCFHMFFFTGSWIRSEIAEELMCGSNEIPVS